MKKTLLAGIAALFLAMGTAHARSLNVTCDGNIGWYPLKAYTEIRTYGNDDSSCIFITKSRIVDRFLRVCPKNSLCLVKAFVENAVGPREIYRLFSVKRIYDSYVEEPPCDLYKDCGKSPPDPLPPPKIPVAQ